MANIRAMFRRDDQQITEVIRHHWNWRAATFDQDPSQGLHSETQRRAWLELLSRLAGPPPKRVLDVGCGTGFLALLLAELGHRVTGVDLAPEMLERAQAKAAAANVQLEFRVENAAQLTDADETYDFLIERHVLWTLPDPAQGISEWLRVLRPGARLALIEERFANNEQLAREYAHPLRVVIDSIVEGGMSLLSLIARKKYGKLYSRRYRRIQAQLPFSGGPTVERLSEFLAQHGVQNVEIQSLMDPALWEKQPEVYRYLASGTR